MGFPMAGHLANAGYKVTVYNRTASKAEQWLEAYPGAANTSAIAKTPEEAAEGADIVFMCVGDDNDVREIGTRALSRMKSDAVLVDHTTASADIARELDAACRKQKVHFLDAPVSGGVSAAAGGTLTFMVGGDADAFDKAHGVLSAMGKKIVHAGGHGAGQAAKICNNMLLGATMIATCESFQLAQKLGLDAQVFFDIASNASGQTWSMTTYCPVKGLSLIHI